MSHELKRVISKHRLFDEEQRKLLTLLVNNFLGASLVIKENLKEDSPVRHAFEEFKSIVD